MQQDGNIVIRPLVASDEAAWRRLWNAYLVFYGATVAESVYDLTFSRLLSGGAGEYAGCLGLVGGRPAGLVHFLFHRHCWHAEDVVYLQDLFVAADTRGTGLGRALIEHVYAEADARGAADVYWLTQQSNATARQLYDRIARPTEFMKYHRGAA